MNNLVAKSFLSGSTKANGMAIEDIQDTVNFSVPESSSAGFRTIVAVTQVPCSNVSQTAPRNDIPDRNPPHKGINALDIANYFLHKVDREAGDTISPLKLQKLVYYAQAWNLVLKDSPLFSEAIQAWVHGPAIYEVWDAYKQYKYSAIPEPQEPLPEFTDDQLDVLNEVWDAYGGLSAKQLETLTHSELPWVKARQGLDPGEKSRSQISLDDMKAYYSSLMVNTGGKE